MSYCFEHAYMCAYVEMFNVACRRHVLPRHTRRATTILKCGMSVQRCRKPQPRFADRYTPRSVMVRTTARAPGLHVLPERWR